MALVRLDDPLDELVPNDILVAELDERDAVHVGQDLANLDQPRGLVAGKVGGLKTGVHLRATGMHPARVLITAMRAAGYSGSSLGEVSGEIPGLRG